MYNKDLTKRFISDYKLPIPVINEELFMYHINLYNTDYGSNDKYEELIKTINDRYNGDYHLFLDDYYNTREKIIQETINSEAYKVFNKMNISHFSIKNTPKTVHNNIFNQECVGKFFISVDLKKANFQVLSKINKEIVRGADTYEDFIGKFTDLDYIKSSKYTRQVIFGMLNPKRHLTIEKYYIIQIYERIVNNYSELSDKLVTISNDELVFCVDFLSYNDKLKCFTLRSEIEKIAKEIGFSVHVDFFFLRGFNLSITNCKKENTFFKKEYFISTDSNFKLICVPLPYHSICYKLYKGLDLCEYDYHFDYEGKHSRLLEEFSINEVLT